MRVLIVDDEAPARAKLRRMLAAFDDVEVIGEAADGALALVFVTAFDRFALQAFDANAVDYLLKPVEPERLARAVQRLRARPPSKRPSAGPPEQLLIADRGRTHVVRCADIHWLQAADNYVTVHVSGGHALLMRRTLAGLVGDLGARFVRTHRSAAVALAHVAAVQPRDKGDATVVLRSGVELPCSRQYRAELLRRLNG